MKYFKNHVSSPTPAAGACSAIRKGQWYGRNFDWTYDEHPEFIIHMAANAGRYASLGVASSFQTITDEGVKQRRYYDEYNILPFKVVDGINECGVVINTNVVPLEENRPIPTPSTKDIELCTSMVPRFILDNFSTAQSAVDYLKDHVNLYLPKHLIDQKYDVHFMIADEENTFIVESYLGEIHYIERAYMTNFLLYPTEPNLEGKPYYTPADVPSGHYPGEQVVADYSAGLERYNLIDEVYDSISGKESMRNLLKRLYYTNTYKSSTNPFWYSEYVDHDRELTVNNKPIDFKDLIALYRKAYEHRSRDPQSPAFGTWQTSHSSIYDIYNKKLYITAQEDDSEYEFEL